MSTTAVFFLVNGSLVEIHRSLLQYTAEAWPWSSDADVEAQHTVMALAAKQEESVKACVEYLQSHKQPVDFGVYPHEYTSLHFVSLDYLLKRINESEANLVAELESVAAQVADDAEASDLLKNLIESEKGVQGGLEELKVAAG